MLLNLDRVEAKAWVIAHLPPVEGHVLHHRFFDGWRDGKRGPELDVPLIPRSGVDRTPIATLHFELIPIDQTHTEVRAHAGIPLGQGLRTDDMPVGRAILARMFEDVREAGTPCPAPSNPHGTQGGTLDRAREARELIESGTLKTEACKRAHIDPRTYDRYAENFVNWSLGDK
jgi:hypothetical protein